ncbi:MAG: YraN family protein [Planctomycetes bacterium]|nr:YraN family protein [Planctomycetota bacterium]
MIPNASGRPRLGPLGETIVARHYERRGAHVIGRNVRNLGGEIDLVVRDGPTLVAVEVKTRTVESRDAAFGSPAEAVDARRLFRLSRALESYAAAADISAPLRIDVAEVIVNNAREVLDLRILENVTN